MHKLCCLIECVSYKIHSKTKLGNRKKNKILFNFIPQNQWNIMEVKEIVKAEISRANKWYIQNIYMIYKTMIKSEEEASPNVAQNLVGFHLRFLVRCWESKPSAARCCSTSASSAHSYRRVWRLPSCSRRWVCPANAHCKAREEEGGISEGFLALISL